MSARFWVGIGVLLAVLVAGYFGWQAYHPAVVPSIVGGENASPLNVPLSKSYTNAAHNFSLNMPEGYSARELPADDSGVSTVVIENSSSDGVQIRMQPFSGDVRVLTADMVKADIPGIKMDDVQTVTIGADYQGIAFKSDNDAFNGDSREVWFVFRGTLYQISTYARLDPLLKGIFSTWRFF